MPAESITIGLVDDTSHALIYLADDKGFFARNSLNVTLKKYDTGMAAANAAVKGEVDIAGATEYIVVGKAFQKEQISIIATRDRSQSIHLIARKDRGILNISDLKGKKIGLARRTISEFYLGRFLNLNGINLQDVTLADLKPAEFTNAISSGDVDALVAWQPFVFQILDKEGSLVVSWPANGSQPAFDILLSSNAWLTRHSDTVKRFLKSLSQAEDYLVRHPAEAKAIVQKRLNYMDAYTASIWPQHQFSVTLNQTLIIAMKDEAQWMMSNNLISEKTIPDFTNYVYTDALKAVKPEVVNVIK